MLKNYRPISLTNVDYKILAFVLSARLQKVICNLVSQEQTAYIKHRFIGQNIRFINDIIDYTEQNKIISLVCYYFLILRKHLIG